MLAFCTVLVLPMVITYKVVIFPRKRGVSTNLDRQQLWFAPNPTTCLRHPGGAEGVAQR